MEEYSSDLYDFGTALAGKFSAKSYAAALQSLLPTGRAWPRDQDANQSLLMVALSRSFSRNDATAQRLLYDAFPTHTAFLLPEWEATLGLPDPCLGSTPTLTQRQASVTARFTAVSGDNVGFYQSYMTALGYTITITPQSPFRMGFNGMGDPIGDSEWFFYWVVTGADDSVSQCELLAIVPAHVSIIFR